ncbi:MAG: MBL fold metallo-hydrolase [Deltaproteobacteria bacterium]|nr:MBL fold metallo-hydrolase [Deltaproteobacteria bacterium]
MLDCGCNCDARVIADYIERELGLKPSAPRLGVASHAHPDHMGGAGRLRREHGFQIAASKEINGWYQGLSGSIQQWIDIELAQFVARSLRRPRQDLAYPRTVETDHILVDGRPLPGFEDWLAFLAPGHTDHDVVLYNQESELLYAGDIIVKVGGKYTLPIPMILRRRMFSSFEKIKHLKVKKLALAHSELHEVRSFREIVEGLQEQLQNESYGFWQKTATAAQHFSPALRLAKKRGD